MLVASGVKEAGHRLVVAGFTGHTNMDVEQYADAFQELKLGKLNKLMKFFKKEGVQRVIMAGTINKPKIMDVGLLDMRAAKLIFKLRGKGDNAILTAITDEFEAEGMAVMGAHQFLPQLLTPEGVLTRRQPTKREWEDLRYGYEAARDLGKLDIGQCIVLREQIVAAVEGLEGTDACIKRGFELGGEECVVVKVFKPGQEERVDLPSFGIDTLRVMAEGKATCIGVEAEKSLFFDSEETIRFADKHKISIVGINDSILKK